MRLYNIIMTNLFDSQLNYVDMLAEQLKAATEKHASDSLNQAYKHSLKVKQPSMPIEPLVIEPDLS